MFKTIVKPTVDVVLAVILVFMLLPILLLLLLLNSMFMNGAIFNQTRIGKNESPFVMYKFKSLKIAGNEHSITAWGRFLRFTSLDELPQLLNIIRGEMSFVGPRPLLPEYLAHYNSRQKKRHQVKPGITGWAQVNGRNALTWEQSLEMDALYAERISFLFDCKILLLTLRQWLRFGQVNAEKNQSRQPFIPLKK